MLLYKTIGLSLCFYNLIVQGNLTDEIRKTLLDKGEALKKELIKSGYSEIVAAKIANKIVLQNLYEYETKNFLINNKGMLKKFVTEVKKFEMDVEHESQFDLVESQFEHKNKLFDKKLAYQKSFDDKEIDYEANKKAKKAEIDIEEYEKARIRAVNKALVGNKEEDRFGRTTPSLGEVLDTAVWKQLMPALLNYKTAKAGVIAGSILGGTWFLAWYAPGLAKDYIMKTFITPRPIILLPGSKIGRWDRFARWKNGYKSPEMIFATEVEERLTDLVNITEMIKKDIKAGLKRTYRNVMLWGPPGTGKTLFANVLADKLDMDFCSITAGSLLQKDVGIQFLNEFATMARKSRYGMILFIDEADALFVDRNTLNIGSEQGLEHYKILNHLLAMTGDGSSKFMLIAATNHAQNIDEAMGRRFQERIYMPLPDELTRSKLVDLYVNKLLFSEKDNGNALVQSAKQVMNTKMLKNIVMQTEGLSGAEIKDIIAQIQNLGLQTKNKAITAAHVKKAVEQGVQKRKDQDNDAVRRQANGQNHGAIVQLTIQPTESYKPYIQSSAPIITTAPAV